MDFSLTKNDVDLLKTYVKGSFADQSNFDAWKDTPGYAALIDSWSRVLPLHNGDGLLFYDAVATPLMTEINNGPEGSGDVSYSHSETVGFTTDTTSSFSVAEEAKAEFMGVGGGVTVTGTVGFSTGTQTSTTDEISMDVAPQYQATLYQGRTGSIVMMQSFGLDVSSGVPVPSPSMPIYFFGAEYPYHTTLTTREATPL